MQSLKRNWSKRSKFGTWLINKFSQWLMHEVMPKRAYLCDFDRIRFEIRPGDVILIEGRHRVSNIIKVITQSPWSHAALYVGRLPEIEDHHVRMRIKKFYDGPLNKQLVVESQLGRGTCVSPIDHYKDDHIRICRPIGLSHDDAQKIVNFAVRRLGLKYSMRHVFDLMRFLAPWPFLPRRWRSTLFVHNALKPTEEICSSMIAEAFASVKFPILPYINYNEEKGLELIQRNRRLFTPSDFDYSPYFAIIKYPIFGLHHHGDGAAYRDLPWKENVYSGDEQTTQLVEETDFETEDIRQSKIPKKMQAGKK